MLGSEFFVVFPRFVIESPDREGLRIVPVGGLDCLALFTDREIASQHVDGEGGTGRLRSFRSADELAQFLRSLDGVRFTRVAFDPLGESRTFQLSIDELLESLERECSFRRIVMPEVPTIH